MNGIRYKIYSVLLLCMFFSAALLLPCRAAAEEKTFLKPKLNDGKKWRIGYIQGGEKGEEYAECLKALVAGLADLGWLPVDAVPNPSASQNHTSFIWQQLSKEKEDEKENESRFLVEFVSDAYWSGDWDQELCEKNREAISNRQDIDLMIAMGTVAGQDIVELIHKKQYSTNTIVIDASNPVASGISEKGRDNIHATLESDRYLDQLAIFHQIVNFKELGFAYKDDKNGKSFAALDDIEKAEKDLDFRLIIPDKCKIDPEKFKQNQKQVVKECYEELAKEKKDYAVYMTSHLGANQEDTTEDDIPQVLAPLLAARVPTFSQTGCEEVEQGVLIGLARPEYKKLGRFQAEVIARIFHGEAPGNIPQNFNDTASKSVCLNMATAQRIGFNPPWELLAAAKHLYWNIQEPSATSEGKEQ